MNTPTENDIAEFARMEGLDQTQAGPFVAYYDGRGWMINGDEIHNWQGLFVKWCDRRGAGGDRKPRPSDSFRPGEHCEMCRESGTVTIWNPDAISALRSGKHEQKLHIHCVTACKCSNGNAFRWKETRSGTVPNLPVFGDSKWHCVRTMRNPKETTTGRAFSIADDIAEHGTEVLQAFASGQQANYNSGFDDFNNR